MRFDEAFTFLRFASQPLLEGLTTYAEPNNHLFHTLLVHISTSLFGDQPWAIRLPALLAGVREGAALARADELLAEVGLEARARARPATLSGGEMQRTAIARALVHEPALLLADEPTGNLDSRTADQVIAMLRSLGLRHGATVLLVTHSREAAAAADRVIALRDGRVVSDGPPLTAGTA